MSTSVPRRSSAPRGVRNASATSRRRLRGAQRGDPAPGLHRVARPCRASSPSSAAQRVEVGDDDDEAPQPRGPGRRAAVAGPATSSSARAQDEEGLARLARLAHAARLEARGLERASVRLDVGRGGDDVVDRDGAVGVRRRPRAGAAVARRRTAGRRGSRVAASTPSMRQPTIPRPRPRPRARGRRRRGARRRRRRPRSPGAPRPRARRPARSARRTRPAHADGGQRPASRRPRRRPRRARRSGRRARAARRACRARRCGRRRARRSGRRRGPSTGGGRWRSSCGLSPSQPVQRRLHRALGLGVQRARRLVEHEHRRVAQDGARDRDALLLAAREAVPALAHDVS